QGYKCCSSKCNVTYVDSDGTWGYENNQWCGCNNVNNNSNCRKVGDYSCCKYTTEVAFVDSDAKWGVENNDWCVISN
ncbi:hypothetical protein BCR36DRAFT_238096, partial [Piromyces finnis]